jgi:hypothetical protein
MHQARKQGPKGHVVCDELFALARRSGLWFTFEGHPDGACTITTQSKDQSQDGKRAQITTSWRLRRPRRPRLQQRIGNPNTKTRYTRLF